MKKLLLLAVLTVALFSSTGWGGDSVRMAPDGSYVSGDSVRMAPDGSYVSGGSVRMAPDGSYVGVDD